MDTLLFFILVFSAWIIALLLAKGLWIHLQNPEIGLFYALFRTSRLNTLIDRIARLNRPFWSYLFDLGIIISLCFLFLSLTLFTVNLIRLAIIPETAGAITPAIPLVTIGVDSLPYFMIAIVVIAIIHEFAHGIAARVGRIRLKSTGIFLFLFFLGAFVEPDEKEIQNSSPRTKMRIFAAGATGNLLCSVLFFIILLPSIFGFFISPIYSSSPDGAVIVSIYPDSPAEAAGLKSGWGIQEIIYENETYIIKDQEALREVLSSIDKNKNITFHFDKHESITFITGERPEELQQGNEDLKGFIGITYWHYFKPKDPFYLSPLLPYHFFVVCFFILGLGFVLALVNLLPIPMLDGDKLLQTFLEYIKPEMLRYSIYIRLFALTVLLLNFVGTFLR
ncbi:MAG: site-2 protease family protein, partial [Promethearchaeota archaeon]